MDIMAGWWWWVARRRRQRRWRRSPIAPGVVPARRAHAAFVVDRDELVVGIGPRRALAARTHARSLAAKLPLLGRRLAQLRCASEEVAPRRGPVLPDAPVLLGGRDRLPIQLAPALVQRVAVAPAVEAARTARGAQRRDSAIRPQVQRCCGSLLPRKRQGAPHSPVVPWHAPVRALRDRRSQVMRGNALAPESTCGRAV